MSDNGLLAASLLNGSAGAYAGFAASQFCEKHPEAAQRFGSDAFSAWKANLTVRVRELAVAVEMQSPDLFVASVQWARESFAARDLPQDDLRASLECLTDVLTHDLPEHARDPIPEYCARGLEVFEAPLATTPGLDPSSQHGRMALTYIEACLSGDTRRAMDQILQATENGLDVRSAYFEVIAPAQREVGRLWHLGQLGIHEEHVVTAATHSLLTLLAERVRPQETIDKLVVGSAVGDDQHELGIRMIMDLFAMAGWRSLSLGGHMPATNLTLAVRGFDADLLLLSATLVTHLTALRDAIAEVRTHSPGIKVLVGGLAFQADPTVWRRVGADGFAASVSDAVPEGARLLGISSG